jgi:hypothetical protein
VESSVLQLCNDTLGIEVSSKDISVAHRLKAGKNDRYRPIIVRFASRKVRDEIFRAKRKLFAPRDRDGSSSGNTEKIYISEHLTRGVSNIFFEARKMVRDKRLASAWTHKGLVNVKYSAEANEKPTVIRALADFGRPHL